MELQVKWKFVITVFLKQHSNMSPIWRLPLAVHDMSFHLPDSSSEGNMIYSSNFDIEWFNDMCVICAVCLIPAFIQSMPEKWHPGCGNSENTKNNCGLCCKAWTYSKALWPLSLFALFWESLVLRAFVSSLICIGFVPDLSVRLLWGALSAPWMPRSGCLPTVSGVVRSDSSFGLTAPFSWFPGQGCAQSPLWLCELLGGQPPQHCLGAGSWDSHGKWLWLCTHP